MKISEMFQYFWEIAKTFHEKVTFYNKQKKIKICKNYKLKILSGFSGLSVAQKFKWTFSKKKIKNQKKIKKLQKANASKIALI